MTTRPDLAADRCIEGGWYTVRRPRRGPSDDEVRMLINTHQEGEIAFQLHSLALLGRSIDLGFRSAPIGTLANRLSPEQFQRSCPHRGWSPDRVLKHIGKPLEGDQGFPPPPMPARCSTSLTPTSDSSTKRRWRSSGAEYSLGRAKVRSGGVSPIIPITSPI